MKPVIEEARRVSRAHGVGVITMGDPAKWETWEELEEARRVEPDPERLDEFIAVQLPRRAQDEKRANSTRAAPRSGPDAVQRRDYLTSLWNVPQAP